MHGPSEVSAPGKAREGRQREIAGVRSAPPAPTAAPKARTHERTLGRARRCCRRRSCHHHNDPPLAAAASSSSSRSSTSSSSSMPAE